VSGKKNSTSKSLPLHEPSRGQKKNCHRFQTIPTSDLINLTSLITVFMRKVCECGDDYIFVSREVGLQ